MEPRDLEHVADVVPSCPTSVNLLASLPDSTTSMGRNSKVAHVGHHHGLGHLQGGAHGVEVQPKGSFGNRGPQPKGELTQASMRLTHGGHPIPVPGSADCRAGAPLGSTSDLWHERRGTMLWRRVPGLDQGFFYPPWFSRVCPGNIPNHRLAKCTYCHPHVSLPSVGLMPRLAGVEPQYPSTLIFPNEA